MARAAAKPAKSKSRAAKRTSGRKSSSPLSRAVRPTRQISAFSGRLRDGDEDPIESSESEAVQAVQRKAKTRGTGGGPKRARSVEESDVTELEESLELGASEADDVLEKMVKASKDKQAQAVQTAQQRKVEKLVEVYTSGRDAMRKGADQQFKKNSDAIVALLKMLDDAAAKGEIAADAQGMQTDLDALQGNIDAMGKGLEKLVKQMCDEQKQAISETVKPLRERKKKLLAAKHQIRDGAADCEAAAIKQAKRAFGMKHMVEGVELFVETIRV